MQTTLTIEITVSHDDEIDVEGVVDRVLDTGVLQEAIVAYASDTGLGAIAVTSATCFTEES